ncbi:MAG TPA: hypothetical protein DD727_06640, partial [Clostridiales bacterium]|nr:hypothetical protein [Clostridiales bacterium]
MNTHVPPILLPCWDSHVREIPERPGDPSLFPEEDARHWYDLEYAGWNTAKVNIPESPGDGPTGKRIICLLHGRHPYTMAYARALSSTAAANRIRLEVLWADWDPMRQASLVEEAVASRPDLIILVPESTAESTRWFRRINEAG